MSAERAAPTASSEAPLSSAETSNPLEKEILARVDRLKKDDPIGAARAHVELGLLSEWVTNDRERAKKHYEAARAGARSLQPALVRLRRVTAALSVLSGSQPDSKEILGVLEDEIAISESDELRADLLATRARIHEEKHELPKARSAYLEALKLIPKHPASLHGLETILRREITEGSKAQLKDLSEHLAKVAEAYSPDGVDGDASLAAWICVERAEILKKHLDDTAGATDALKRGVALSPHPGPVRSAYVRHLAQADRDAGLSEALAVEAERESDADRAARLLYASARIALDRGGAHAEAMDALTRGEQRAAKGSPTQERILVELINQLEIDGDHARVVEYRVRRLQLLKAPEAIGVEYVRIAEAYGRVGRPDLAADAATRALSHDPSSRLARDVLDQTLQRLGRHADRVRVWLNEANATLPNRVRVAAFVRASQIASRNLADSAQAIAALRAAWLLDPGNATVFDGLAALLRPALAATEDQQRNAEARIELYEQAAAAEPDHERKISLYEKSLAIWEDELDRADKTIELAERILAIDPKRRGAVLALERGARRAGDNDRLLRALQEEAKAADDKALAVRLWLEAADTMERTGDRDRALELNGRAMEAQPNNPDAERARVALLRRMARYDDARTALVALATHDPESAFETWLEIADLDESARKSQSDAVDAYRNAQKLRPAHPLPLRSLVRLLRATKNYKRLIAELKTLAKTETDGRALASLQVMAAEVEELAIGDDEAALKSLEAADDAIMKADPTALGDPAILEASERILVRVGDAQRLTRLYAKWLERKPAPIVDHGIRVALAGSLEASNPAQAVEVLEGLVSVVPQHIPALRRLQHLHRARKSHQQLQNVLYASSGIMNSRIARAGCLWEIAAHEQRLGATVAMDALSRVVKEFPRDIGALDTIIRIATGVVATVGVPPQASGAARAQLLAALRARRDLTIDPLARAAYLIEEGMVLETAETPDLAGALRAYREALTLWPDSVLAARGVERLAGQFGDHNALIASQISLAKLVVGGVQRATHLVRAAELTASHLRDERAALELYEVALEADPENKQATRALVTMLAAVPRRLVERLRPALAQAKSRDAVILLGGEIGSAYLRIQAQAAAAPPGSADAAGVDYSPGLQAIKRVLEAQPNDVGTLFSLSRLYGAQTAYGEARDTLIQITELAGSDAKTRQLALFALVDLYEGPIADFARAESTLVSILRTEPNNKLALDRLFKVAEKTGDKKLARATLERLADSETDLGQRTEYQLRVAETCREANDGAGVLKALTDAVLSTPADIRPWTLLARCYRTDTQEGAGGLAHAIEQIIEMAKARRRPAEARWLLTLGLLEVNMLKRLPEGTAHLAAAVAAAAGGPPSVLAEVRAGQAVGFLSAGRTKEAVQLLRELVTQDAETLLRLAEPGSFVTVKNASVASSGTVLAAVLSCLDAALATEGRPEECVPVEEVRAALGELSGDRVQKLRSRRLDAEAPRAGALVATDLARVLVPEARSPMIDVAIAIQPIATKVLRFDLATLGVASRDRIGPRDGHPTRQLADRIARALGVTDFELYLTQSWSGAIRVYPGDPPALIGPVSIVDLPEGEQMFALGRLLTRIALGATWLDEVSNEMADALLVSAVRSAIPQFAFGELTPQREHAVANVLPAMQRAFGRKQRRAIEDHAAQLSGSYDMRALSIALRRSEFRAGYVLSGDLLGCLEYLRRFDADVGRATENPRVYLQHPVTSELVRYALSHEAHGERRRLGTVWAK